MDDTTSSTKPYAYVSFCGPQLSLQAVDLVRAQHEWPGLRGEVVERPGD